MKRLFLAGLFVVFTASIASAQVATPTNRFGWDQPNASVSDAQGYEYKLYRDGSPTGEVLSSVTCVAGTPVACSAPIPAFTPGQHEARVSAGNVAGESLPSTPLPFMFVAVPSTPTNLRLE